MNIVVKDFTFGIFIIVVSIFFLYPVYYYVGPGNPFALFGVVFSTIVGYKIFDFGYDLAFKGIELDNNEDDSSKK